MLSRTFWRDTFERVISTAAEFALVAAGADFVDALDADWKLIAGAAGAGAFAALCKALIAGKTVGSPDSASLDPEASPRILGKA